MTVQLNFDKFKAQGPTTLKPAKREGLPQFRSEILCREENLFEAPRQQGRHQYLLKAVKELPFFITCHRQSSRFAASSAQDVTADGSRSTADIPAEPIKEIVAPSFDAVQPWSKRF